MHGLSLDQKRLAICMEATKLFDSHTEQSRVCWIAMLVLVFSIVGSPLALYLGRRSHKPDPTNPGYRLHSVSCTGKGQVTFRGFVCAMRVKQG